MAIYAIGIAIFMVLENKSPQSTLAWIFIFFVFPVIRLVIHFMIGRDHRAFSHCKMVVIDGKAGYIGGINMAKAYRDGPETGNFIGWRDTHTRVTGQVVWSLQLSGVNKLTVKDCRLAMLSTNYGAVLPRNT